MAQIAFSLLNRIAVVVVSGVAIEGKSRLLQRLFK